MQDRVGSIPKPDHKETGPGSITSITGKNATHKPKMPLKKPACFGCKALWKSSTFKTGHKRHRLEKEIPLEADRQDKIHRIFASVPNPPQRSLWT